MYLTPVSAPRNFGLADFLERAHAMTPDLILALSQSRTQREIAARIASNETTISLAKSGERRLDDGRLLALIGYAVGCGCYAPVERLLSADPAAPDLVIACAPPCLGDPSTFFDEIADDQVVDGRYVQNGRAALYDAMEEDGRIKVTLGYRYVAQARALRERGALPHADARPFGWPDHSGDGAPAAPRTSAPVGGRGAR